MTRQLLATVYQTVRSSGPVTRNAACAVAEGIGSLHYEWDVWELGIDRLKRWKPRPGSTWNGVLRLYPRDGSCDKSRGNRIAKNFDHGWTRMNTDSETLERGGDERKLWNSKIFLKK